MFTPAAATAAGPILVTLRYSCRYIQKHRQSLSMANTPASAPANDRFDQNSAEQLILREQLQRVELLNGRAAMVGIVIGILTEAITGSGIAHQIGLGALVDGYAACRTQFLPFCF